MQKPDDITDRDWQIFTDRNTTNLTLEQLAAKHSVSRERIRQIVARALRHIARDMQDAGTPPADIVRTMLDQKAIGRDITVHRFIVFLAPELFPSLFIEGRFPYRYTAAAIRNAYQPESEAEGDA